MSIVQPVMLGRVQAFRPLGYSSPMLSNPGLGGVDLLNILGSVAQFLAENLGKLINEFANLLEIPLSFLSQGVDFAFNGVAGLVGEIPWVGSVLSEIILVGAAIVKFGLSIPGLLLHGLGNLLEGWGAALDAKLTQREKEKKLAEERKKIIDNAPESIQDSVEAIIDNSGVGSGDILDDVTDALIAGGDVREPLVPPEIGDEPPEVGESTVLEKILPIAAPAAVGTLALMLLLR